MIIYIEVFIQIILLNKNELINGIKIIISTSKIKKIILIK